MEIFPQLGLLGFLRAALAVATAGFLPGFFLYAILRNAKSLRSMLFEEFFETICVSLAASLVLLGLLSVLLTFTIGFSNAAIAVTEAALIIGCWELWKKKTG